MRYIQNTKDLKQIQEQMGHLINKNIICLLIFECLQILDPKLTPKHVEQKRGFWIQIGFEISQNINFGIFCTYP